MTDEEKFEMNMMTDQGYEFLHKCSLEYGHNLPFSTPVRQS